MSKALPAPIAGTTAVVLAEMQSSALKFHGAVLDQALRGPVRIKRRSTAYILMTEQDFDAMVAQHRASETKPDEGR